MALRQPVSVGGIKFDALVSQDTSYSATVPQYTLESGYSVSDDILLNPEEISMTLFVSATPVTWLSQLATGKGRPDFVVKQLEALYMKAEPITVITHERVYTDMAISSFSVSKSAEIGYAREIPITFKKIYWTETATVSIPSTSETGGDTEEAQAETETEAQEGTALSSLADAFDVGGMFGSNKQ